jgi:hypothetical protein
MLPTEFTQAVGELRERRPLRQRKENHIVVEYRSDAVWP